MPVVHDPESFDSSLDPPESAESLEHSECAESPPLCTGCDAVLSPFDRFVPCTLGSKAPPDWSMPTMVRASPVPLHAPHWLPMSLMLRGEAMHPAGPWFKVRSMSCMELRRTSSTLPIVGALIPLVSSSTLAESSGSSIWAKPCGAEGASCAELRTLRLVLP